MRSVSANAVRSINASETGEVWLYLLTIEQASLTEPIRITSDAVDTVSRGESYVSFPFELVLPTADEGRPARARLVIDNVDRRITEAIRLIDSPATVRIESVLGRDPDHVEVAYGKFRLTAATVTLARVEADLTLTDWATAPFPYDRFDPTRFRNIVA